MIRRYTYLVEFVVHGNDAEDIKSRAEALDDAFDKVLELMDHHMPYTDEINVSGPAKGGIHGRPHKG